MAQAFRRSTKPMVHFKTVSHCKRGCLFPAYLSGQIALSLGALTYLSLNSRGRTSGHHGNDSK
ncbi:hypothetical protein BU26DRAFT_516852 [Trematosphaeria pertusa]|uniref:Uncharacterized protein n=1 Tax=Trematosphaeria pertusa TaxID=390896 RepID=A0A6A6IQU5_9PLEO|nr:uncharacterized protein BU26DRAFT_516852 [Trematosphaeria pertusa]KAF2252162.1 hypothetical protein BU26DRAFT_516852 [Trematosphaeria pertusa]